MIQDAIAQLLEGRTLDESEAKAAMNEIMAGEATEAQTAGFLVALRAKGETADEIVGLCARAAGARRPGRAESDRPRRHGRHGRRRRADAQHLDRCGARRCRRRRGRREARQPRGLLGVGLGRRPRGTRLRARAAARADRALDRRARLRLHLRAGAPPGLPPCGAGAAGARDANRLQRARAADEPRRGARADRGRLRGGARAGDRGRALPARRQPCVRRPRRGRDRRAVAGRSEHRRRGVRGRGLDEGDRPRGAWRSPLRARRPTRGHACGERRGDPRGVSRRDRAAPRRDPLERRRRDRGSRARQRSRGRPTDRVGDRSTRVQPRSGSRS